MFEIMIGEFYINNIYVNDESVNTYYIKSIDLSVYYSRKFDSSEVARTIEILENLGISRDSLVVKEVKEYE